MPEVLFLQERVGGEQCGGRVEGEMKCSIVVDGRAQWWRKWAQLLQLAAEFREEVESIVDLPNLFINF